MGSSEVGHCYNDTKCPANQQQKNEYYSFEFCCNELNGKAYGPDCTPCNEDDEKDKGTN
jgi:hypothetical protein